MNSMRMTLLLLLLNLGALILLMMPYTEDSLSETSGNMKTGVQGDLFQLASYERSAVPASDVMLDAPLFNEGRVPDSGTVQEAVTANVASNTGGGLVLVGIVLTADVSEALLQNKNNEVLRLGVEESIEGWRLKRVESDRVILEKSGQEKELILERTPVSQKAAAGAGLARRLELIREQATK